MAMMLAGVLGTFMRLGGLAKVTDSFATMFAQQIALSGLPFPKLSAVMGQAGEIGSGAVLLGFFMFGDRFQGLWTDRIFS